MHRCTEPNRVLYAISFQIDSVDIYIQCLNKKGFSVKCIKFPIFFFLSFSLSSSFNRFAQDFSHLYTIVATKKELNGKKKLSHFYIRIEFLTQRIMRLNTKMNATIFFQILERMNSNKHFGEK